MPGRNTHDYPNGKPLPITLSEIAFGVVVLFWILAPITWVRVAVFGALFFAFLWVRSRLLTKYERLGQAVRKPPQLEFIFPDGMPTPLRVMRFTVVVPMIAMIAFGMAPLAIARIGIIACVLILFVMAGVYVGLQWHYVHTQSAGSHRQD
jgi:hypothetical protein